MSKSKMTEVNAVQQDRRSIQMILQSFANLIKWLVDTIRWTEEEQEAAGIYLGHLWETNKFR